MRNPGIRVVCLMALVSPILAQTLLDNYPPDVLEKFGAEHYGRGQPDQALEYYAKAIEKEPTRISSLLAAAKILESGFQTQIAVALFRRVLAIEPNSRDALAGISHSAQSPDERVSAARKLVSIAKGGESRLALERVRMLEALGGRPAFETADTGRSYRYALVTFQLQGRSQPQPPAHALSIVAPNGERLTFLISTATEGICMNRRAAKAFGARFLFNTYYPWLLTGAFASGKQELIETLPIGDLVLRNCPVFVRDWRFAYGTTDGVIGVEALHDFRVEIDYPASELRLTPALDAPEPAPSKYFVAMRRFGPFLMVPVHIDLELTPYFAVNTIASHVIFQSGMLPDGVHSLTDRGTLTANGWACTDWQHSIFDVALIVGMSRWAGQATSCKMGDLNRTVGFKVTGVLGYSMLRWFSLVIDYQRGMMGFIPTKAAQEKNTILQVR